MDVITSHKAIYGTDFDLSVLTCENDRRRTLSSALTINVGRTI